ncbi:MAG: PKD-like domain-containing protein [Bacteroidales bacterium]
MINWAKTISKMPPGRKDPVSRVLLLLCIFLLPFTALQAQVISNSGAVLSITSNAALTTRDVNMVSGQVVNNGLLELKGDWTNNGLASSGSGIWLFNGTANQLISRPAGTETFYNLVIDNTGSGTEVLLDNSLTVGNLLSVTAGKLNLADGVLTVNDSTRISGTLTDNLSTGTDRFKGPVIIEPGGNWDFTGTETPTFENGLTFNGASFISGTGQYNFTTNPQELNSNSKLVFDADIDINSITLTNKTDVWARSASQFTSTGSWVNSTGSRLRYDYVSVSNLILNGNLDASAAGNTVIYGGLGTQLISPNSSYYTLELMGSGIKSTGSSFNILHKLSIENGVTLDMQAVGIQVYDSLSLINGFIDATGGDQLTLGQNTVNAGTLHYVTGSIYGPFERWLNSTGTKLFPVGDKASGTNHTASFEINNLGAAGSLRVEFLAGDPGNTGLPLLDLNDSSEIADQFTTGYWSALARNSFATPDYDLHLMATGFNSFPIDSGTRIIKRVVGGPWTLDGTHSYALDPQVNRESLNDGIDNSNGNEYGLGHSHPVIVDQPDDLEICETFTSVFSVHAAGAAPLTYQWFKDAPGADIQLTNNGHFSGVNTRTLTISNTLLADSGTYYCRIRDKHGNINYTRHARLVVNKIPNVTLSQSSDTICNNTTVTITPTSDVTGTTFEWTVAADAGVTGASDGAGLTISHTLANTNNFAAKVIYSIKPVGPSSTTCEGLSKNDTVWVEPTPRLVVSVPDTIICDSSLVTFTVASLNGITKGAKKYLLTTAYDPLKIQNVEPDGEKSTGTGFSDLLVNLTNGVQWVEYRFRAFIGNHPANCGSGTDTTIRIYVNPTPRLSVSIPDTIICDSSDVNITVNDGLLGVQGTKVYQLTTTDAGGNVLGVQASGEYTADLDISDNLINLTNQVQVVTYTFRPRINDPRNGGIPFCDNGKDTTLTIYVNPTPRMSVSVPDTIICDSSDVNITVNDGLLGVQGTKVYQLTTTDAGGNVLGVQASGEYAADLDISDNLINLTNQVQVVTYTFRPRIDDPRNGGIPFCDNGKDTTHKPFMSTPLRA